MPIEQITLLLNYILGSTTIISIYIAWKSRKSEVKKAEAIAMENMQTVYDKFTEQTNRKFEEMQSLINKQAEEIKTLKSQIADNEKRCKQCQK